MYPGTVSNLPPSMATRARRGQIALPKEVFMRSDLEVGNPFANIALPDHSGHHRTLSELAGGDPMILNFYRGWWCPKEQQFMRGLVRLQDEVEVAYTRMVSVTVDAPEVICAFRAGLGARWTFLSDAERKWLHELDMLETTDTVHNPYLPYAFTLYPDLTIHAVYNGYWFWGRPTLEELRRDMREITQKVRPDFDLQKAGCRT